MCESRPICTSQSSYSVQSSFCLLDQLYSQHPPGLRSTARYYWKDKVYTTLDYVRIRFRFYASQLTLYSSQTLSAKTFRSVCRFSSWVSRRNCISPTRRNRVKWNLSLETERATRKSTSSTLPSGLRTESAWLLPTVRILKIFNLTIRENNFFYFPHLFLIFFFYLNKFSP